MQSPRPQHTHNTQPFYGSLDSVRDKPGEPAPEAYISPSSGLSGARWR